MKTKTFYFDVETTGLAPTRCAIRELAFIIDIDGVEERSGCLRSRPSGGDYIDDKAMAKLRVDMEAVANHPLSQMELHTELCLILGQHVNQYNKTDKFSIVAYNGNFDIGFLQCLFKKCGDKYYGSWFNHKLIDPLMLIRAFEMAGKIDKLPNHKLVTVCEYFNIPITAHDAMSDIEATKELTKILLDHLTDLPRTKHDEA